MRALFITIIATVVVAFVLAAPVPKWAGKMMGSALGSNHPAVSCVHEPEIKCTWEKLFRIVVLVNLKKALPENSGMRSSVDNMIDLYSNPYRQNERNRRFEEAEAFFRTDARRSSRSYGGSRRY